MAIALFLTAVMATFAWIAVSHAQYCTPSGPYSAANLNTYPLVNLSTVPVPQDYTTAQMVSTVSQAVKDYIVKKHNCLRSRVPAANMLAMQWNDEAAVKAQQHANRCVYQHDAVSSRDTSQFSCGQNIAMNTGPGPLSWKTMIDMWYNEVNSCTDATASSCKANSVIGHYTQLVWASSWQIGCGWTNCGSMNLFVCNYCPIGNVQGQPLYKAGLSCSACPNSCSVGKLCTNTCGYTDKYTNCDAMMAPPGTCTTGRYKDDCKATCLCNKNAAATTTTPTTPTTTTTIPTTSTTTAATTTPATKTATSLASTTKQATPAPTTTMKPATTIATGAAATPSSVTFEDLPRPNSFETCDDAHCIAELRGSYQIGQCLKQYCSCTYGEAKVEDCYMHGQKGMDGYFYDGSTGNCKVSNSTWCPLVDIDVMDSFDRKFVRRNR